MRLDPPPRATAGFTIVEVMVVVALVALLAFLAAPSFTRQLNAAAVSAAMNQFLADMRFARSEAVRRGGGVVLCRSDDPEASAATCATVTGAAGWATGWIVFHDRDGNAVRDAGEPLLRIQARPTRVDSIATNGTATIFRFGATGRLVVPGATASLHFGGPDLQADVRRVVCVNPAGRARTAGDGTAFCGPEG
jgi:type IV fimbrial biogenesis protein FimT